MYGPIANHCGGISFGNSKKKSFFFPCSWYFTFFTLLRDVIRLIRYVYQVKFIFESALRMSLVTLPGISIQFLSLECVSLIVVLSYSVFIIHIPGAAEDYHSYRVIKLPSYPWEPSLCPVAFSPKTLCVNRILIILNRIQKTACPNKR